MERYSVITDRKTQYCQDVSFILTLIYRFKAIPINIPASYFMAINKLILNCMPDRQKIQNSQWNTEGEKSWRTDATRQLRVTINRQQSRNSAVFTKEQTSRSMTKNRQPGNRPKEIQPIIIDKG